MIEKRATVNLSQEDIDSPEDIKIVLTVNGPGGEGDGVDYTITYPKSAKNPLKVDETV